MGMNNLLYNYQNNNEFVCSDGRMSVNGICKTPEQAIQPIQPITSSPVQDNDGSDDNRNNYEYDKTVKSTFEWDFDKPNNKVENFATTVKDNITAYDKYVGEKFGISSKSITLNRVGATGVTLGQGGSLTQVASPWGWALGIGQMMKGKDKPEVIDTMSFNDAEGTPYQDYGQGGADQSTQDSYEDSSGSYTGQGEASDWGGGE